MPEAQHVWALILAGGDGSRLRALTTKPCGTAVPKQFCSLHGQHCLLDHYVREEPVLGDSLVGALEQLDKGDGRPVLLGTVPEAARRHRSARRLRRREVPHCGWSDLGTPRRVGETLRRLRLQERTRPVAPGAVHIDLAVQHARFESMCQA